MTNFSDISRRERVTFYDDDDDDDDDYDDDENDDDGDDDDDDDDDDNDDDDDDDSHFVLDQHAELEFNSASSLRQQSTGRHVTLLSHIILIPSQPVFVLISLIQRI